MIGAVLGGAAASIVGGVLGAKGSERAGELSAGAADRATAETRRQYDITRQDLMPWMRAATGEPIYETDPETGEPIIDEATGEPKIAGYEGGALQEYSGYGRSRVAPGDYIPESDIPTFDPNLDLYTDPSYDWRKSEMERGINRNMGGMGKIMSGNRIEELMARGGEMASQEYGNMWGRALDDYKMRVGRESDLYGRGVDEYGRAYGEEGDYLNRLASISKVGQTTATEMGRTGAAAASETGRNIRAAGDAQAAARMGRSSAWSNALGDAASLAARYQPGSTTTDYSIPMISRDYA